MNKRTSILDLHKKKNATKIVALTCYTAQLAKILDNHVDILLVGDSLGMTIYGHNNTLSVTKRMMIDHIRFECFSISNFNCLQNEIGHKT